MKLFALAAIAAVAAESTIEKSPHKVLEKLENKLSDLNAISMQNDATRATLQASFDAIEQQIKDAEAKGEDANQLKTDKYNLEWKLDELTMSEGGLAMKIKKAKKKIAEATEAVAAFEAEIAEEKAEKKKEKKKEKRQEKKEMSKPVTKEDFQELFDFVMEIDNRLANVEMKMGMF